MMDRNGRIVITVPQSDPLHRYLLWMADLQTERMTPAMMARALLHALMVDDLATEEGPHGAH